MAGSCRSRSTLRTAPCGRGSTLRSAPAAVAAWRSLRSSAAILVWPCSLVSTCASGSQSRASPGAQSTLTAWASLADPAAERGASPVFAVATAPIVPGRPSRWRGAPGRHAAGDAGRLPPDATWVTERVAELRERWRSPVLVDTALPRPGGGRRGAVAGRAGEGAQRPVDAVLAGMVHHGNEAGDERRGARGPLEDVGRHPRAGPQGPTDISPLVAAARGCSRPVGAESPVGL
jgi:hypothetical protein